MDEFTRDLIKHLAERLADLEDDLKSLEGLVFDVINKKTEGDA